MIDNNTLEQVAPYMVKLQPACAFTDWLLTGGWDRHWHIVVETPMDFKACRKHLRKFLQTKSPTVIASVVFQHGTDAPTFWRYVTAQNWTAAIAELRDFKDFHASRRKREADYVESH